MRPAFLYDSDCGWCTRFQRAASFLDTSRSVEFVSIRDAARKGILATVPQAKWYESSRMVHPDGTMSSGGDSVVDLLSLLPGLSLPARAVGRSVPGRLLAEKSYGVLSRLHGASCVPSEEQKT